MDHTLWDLEKNAGETLVELFEEFRFSEFTSCSPEDFVALFQKHNKEQWVLYEQKSIDKRTLREQRFQLAMNDMGIAEKNRPATMWNLFLERCPARTNLMPNAREVLEFLCEKYPVYILTNGFAETQRKKLKNAGLSSFVKGIVISEETGYRKPQKEIFDHALETARAKPFETVLIGDSLEADVMGAVQAGWEAVFFNPEKKTTELPLQVAQIHNLLELKERF